jgi:hypothetical protein
MFLDRVLLTNVLLCYVTCDMNIQCHLHFVEIYSLFFGNGHKGAILDVSR